ncbi:hypothetical protein [Marinomonas foliarum]|uniref:Uncharacterized protein n=1 Tax=Marinomonas foliarum TaxID=491950 RepID=A0A368ZKL5_9GAMM|nr:hypothetical protein [Marinomonas foliarum]RCW94628.1 hypothetical protein DFP77_14526 [Marinomonas foliarum]
MENELITDLLGQIVLGLLLVVPLWKIHGKAGKNPALALFVFIPYLGLLIVSLVLAFSRWPATEYQNNAAQQEG